MPKKRNENKKMCLYLDTCILRNAFSKRNKDDILLLEYVRKNKLTCVTSIYTLLELYEISKDRKFLMNLVVDGWAEVNTYLRNRSKKDLNIDELLNISEQINNLFRNYDFIEFRNIAGDNDWNLLKEICEVSNLHLSDNIHLATAYINDCTHLITRDDFFIEEGNKILRQNDIPPEELKICSPNEILKNS